LLPRQQTIWFDKLAGAINNTSREQLEILEAGEIYDLGILGCDREDVRSRIFNKLKSMDNDKRILALNRLFSELDEDISQLPPDESRMLTWQQINGMVESVVEIGSHTVTHPILSKLTPEQLHYELAESKQCIESHIGKSISSIAYPNGGRNDFNQDVINEAKNTGYLLGFTYIAANNYLPLDNPFEIDRLHIELSINSDYFKCLLCLPKLFRG